MRRGWPLLLAFTCLLMSACGKMAEDTPASAVGTTALSSSAAASTTTQSVHADGQSTTVQITTVTATTEGVVTEVTAGTAETTTATKKATKTTRKTAKTTRKTTKTTATRPTVSPEKGVSLVDGRTYLYTTGQTHTMLAAEQRFHYQSLSPREKVWYDAIDDAVNNFRSDTVYVPIAEEEYDAAREFFFFYKSIHPEHFYLAPRSSLIYNPDQQEGCFTIYYCVRQKTTDPAYLCGCNSDPMSAPPSEEDQAKLMAEIQRRIPIFEQELNRVISTIPSDAPDAVKVRMAFNYLINTCVHTEVDPNFHFYAEGYNYDSAYRTLIHKEGQYEGYARAMQMLCLAMGIDTIYGNPIGWMLVATCLDGEWYWSDPYLGHIGSDRFNINAATARKQYDTFDEYDWRVPETASTKYSFKNYFR